MKYKKRDRWISILCIGMMLCAGQNHCLAESISVETEETMEAQENTYFDLQEESLYEESLLLAKITGDSAWFYYDEELTEPAFPARKDESYILLQDSADEADVVDVVCVEALDAYGEVVSVYVSAEYVQIWEEENSDNLREDDVTDFEIENGAEEWEAANEESWFEEEEDPDTTEPGMFESEWDTPVEIEDTVPEEAEDVELLYASMDEEDVIVDEAYLAQENESRVPITQKIYVSVCTRDQLLVPPMIVYHSFDRYSVDETCLDIIKMIRGHYIETEADGAITAVDDCTGDFHTYTETGETDVNMPIGDQQFLVVSEQEVVLSEGYRRLIRVMAEFLSNGSEKTEAADEIYHQILEVYMTLSDEEAGEWAQKLEEAQKSQPVIEAGEEQEPEQIDGIYQISSGGECKWFADLVNGDLANREAQPDAGAVLVSDIGISEYLWKPIGSPEHPFVGIFDGAGHQISGLNICSDEHYQAFIGYAGEGAVIRDLTVSGRVESKANYVAGIVAYSEVPLSGLCNRCDVYGSGEIGIQYSLLTGGVVAALSGSQLVSNCRNEGTVYQTNEGHSTQVGGIGGDGGSYVSCVNTGFVYGGRDCVGGIAGTLRRNGDFFIRECVNYGEVQSGCGSVGGIAGSTTNISDCINYGTVSASNVTKSVVSNVGGIVGYGDAEQCTNYGMVTCIFGKVSDIGGIAGYGSGDIVDCKNYGTVQGNDRRTGGIAGEMWGSSTGFKYKALRCENYGEVRSSGYGVGGITGEGRAEQCFNLASVTGLYSVGGINGGAYNGAFVLSGIGQVESCYNMGTITGEYLTGGLSGYCRYVRNSYNTGEVFCRDLQAGAVAGKYTEVTNCYYLNTLQQNDPVGIPLSVNELRNALWDTEFFRLNFDTEYHGGFPILAFENHESAAAVDEVTFVKKSDRVCYVLLGEDPAGLPQEMLVKAGGLEFIVKVLRWIPEETYDNRVSGKYVFTPEVALPQGCYLDEESNVADLLVKVGDEGMLPEITAIRMADGFSNLIYTDYGRPPQGLPETAFALVDGEEEEIPISWEPDHETDFTDTTVEIIYTMKLLQAYQLAEEVKLPQITVRVIPQMWIDDLRFHTGEETNSKQFDLQYLGSETADGAVHFYYDLDIMDSTGLQLTPSTVYKDGVHIWAIPSEDAPENMTIRASYTRLEMNSSPEDFQLYPSVTINTYKKARKLYYFAPRYEEYIQENDLLLTAALPEEEGAQVQYYHVHSRIHPTMKSLTASAGSFALFTDPALNREYTEYRLSIPPGEHQMDLQMTTFLPVNELSVTLDGEEIVPGAKGIYNMQIPFEGTEKTVTLVMSHTPEDGNEAKTTYQLVLKPADATVLSLKLSPADASFQISSLKTGHVLPNADGTFTLMRGIQYDYQASQKGYVTVTGTVFADEPEKTLDIGLKEAPVNPSIREDMESEWSNFRGNEENNAVSGMLTPYDSGKALLYWANKAGEAYSSDAVSSPILVDGYLYCTVKNNILKLDTVTGEIVAIGDMVTSSVFNITPPTYGDGMIFVALAGGRVQAFNADTLDSLWVYTDPLGGQPDSPLTYKDGYVYTGFWGSESTACNYVCLSVTDEKPSSKLESKKAVWTYKKAGGFYWAGSYVSDQFLLVGTDDGVSGYTSYTANLLSLDPKTGQVLDCLDDIRADVRSTICYDEQSGRYYFTSKAGWFYSISVSEDGRIDHDDVRLLDLKGGRTGDNGTTPVEGMCTSTPVIWNGRAYVGVSGVGQFNAYNGHCIAVIDLENWEIAYTVPTKGYPQTSGLLTNGYEETGKVYLYFFENASPGTLRIICDSPGQTSPVSVTTGNAITRAEDLFTPRGKQRQFALCSPIVDEYGTIYFKNDSGFMMALGSTIDEISVTAQPKKLIYEEGERFDPAGMQITASYANGLTRDITKYVSWSEAPLQSKDTDITITFEHIMYNNVSEVTDAPRTVVNLTVFSAQDTQEKNQVIALIEAIGEPELDRGGDIEEARRGYDALPDRLKAFVTNYGTLTAAEETYALLEKAESVKVQKVIRLIDAIGDVTLDSGDTIRSAMESYEDLTDYGKVRINNYAVLLEAQKEYQIIVNGQDAQAASVMKQISELGEISPQSGAAIAEARAAYDALPTVSKRRVSNYAVLTVAEETYQNLMQGLSDRAEGVDAMIERIGKVTLEKENLILQVRRAYNELDPDAAARVTKLSVLTAAEKELTRLKQRVKELSGVFAQLDGYAAAITDTAENTDEVTRENAAQIAENVDLIEKLVKSQSSEDQELFASYLTNVSGYKSAVGKAVHMDPVTGVTAEGLAWNQMLQVDMLTSKDTEYVSLEKGMSGQQVIRAYRAQIIDLLTGEAANGHEKLTLQYEMPTPSYNESAYTSIGVVSMGASGTVQAVNSTYTDHKRKLAFSVIGDGVIAVAGTRQEMNAGDSHTSSGSVLDGTGNKETEGKETAGKESENSTQDNTSPDENAQGPQAQNGNHATANNGSVSGSGSVLNQVTNSDANDSSAATGKTDRTLPTSGSRTYASTTGGTAYNSEKQAAMNAYYGDAIASGTWEYQKTVISPVLLSGLSDEQVTLYQNLSLAVEAGDTSFATDSPDQEAFEEVIACYRMTNPLECLVEDVVLQEETQKAEITYMLSKEKHQKIIDEWHAKIELIVTYCLEKGDETVTASRLYQYLTSHMKPYRQAAKQKTEPETEDETAQDDVISGEQAEDDRYRDFAPGPFYGLMREEVATNDAATDLAYLLMQTGIEPMLAQTDLLEPETDPEHPQVAETETESEYETETEIGTESEYETEAESESDSEKEHRYHRWVMFSVNGQWYHADPELDIAAAGSGMEVDVLGHFGINDEELSKAIRKKTGWAPVLPKQRKKSAQKELPICEERLNEYAMTQTVTVKQSEKE